MGHYEEIVSKNHKYLLFYGEEVNIRATRAFDYFPMIFRFCQMSPDTSTYLME